jgi:hypothetical protein
MVGNVNSSSIFRSKHDGAQRFIHEKRNTLRHVCARVELLLGFEVTERMSAKF